jgi:hypothetical protein
MHEQVKITVEGDVLKARFFGTFGKDAPAQAGAVFKEMLAECKAHGCSAIFLDTRGIDLEIGRAGMYESALALAKVVAAKIRVVAVVDPAHLPPDGIFAKLAGLAGAIVAVFTDEDAAMAWLERTRKRPTPPTESNAAGGSEGREK